MKILVLSATEMEVAPARAKAPAADWLCAGVGLPSTIFHLTRALTARKYDTVIQAGIAGVFGEAFPLGETVLVSNDGFGDLGIRENNRLSAIFDAGFADPNEFPFLDSRLPNDHPILQELSLPLASAITVNMVTDDPVQIQLLQDRYQPQIESMEGAGLHYVCRQLNVPFIQLRSISNAVGERDKTKWAMKSAIDNLNSGLLSVLAHLMNKQ